MHAYWDTPRYVRNFERGLKMAWDNYLDGKEINHVIVTEDEERLIGTMEDELFAREQRRRMMARHHLNDELCSWYVNPTTSIDAHLEKQIMNIPYQISLHNLILKRTQKTSLK